MVTTTRRAYESAVSGYEQRSSSGSVELLERPRSYEEFNHAPVFEDELAAAQERRRNLDKLLNYDRYSEVKETETVIDSAVAPAPAVETTAFSDEDIRPTSTTMQFGEDIDSIREEMKAEQQEEKTSLRLNSKGKLVLVLYSLVVTVIMALIILNTGALAKLSSTTSAKVAELSEVMEKYSVLQTEIDTISGSDYIANVAENQLGMIKGN